MIDQDEELKPYPRRAMFVLALKTLLGIVVGLVILSTIGEHL